MENTKIKEAALMAQLENAWSGACRAIIGGEVGPLAKYEKYLSKYVPSCNSAKSAISGKEVSISGNYSPRSKFISGDEIDEYAKIIGKAKLDINAIKDIDSIVDALSGSICYSGNNYLGNSGPANFADRLVDSNFIFKAHDVIYSKNIAFAYICKYSEYIFGCTSIGKDTRFAIRSFEPYTSTRLFETVHIYHSSDCIYSSNLENCQDCLFCFNLRGKRNCIGNLELPKEKFGAVKAKLLKEIRETLAQKGEAPSIVEIIGSD